MRTTKKHTKELLAGDVLVRDDQIYGMVITPPVPVPGLKMALSVAQPNYPTVQMREYSKNVIFTVLDTSDI